MIDFESHKKRLEGALEFRNPDTHKNCIDKIDEKLWRDKVMPALNDISLKATDELQEETGKRYPKDSYRNMDSKNKIADVKSVEEYQQQTGKNIIVEIQNQKEELNPNDWLLLDSNGNIEGVRRFQRYSEAPPTRLLSMTLNLCYFLGFLDASGNHQMDEKRGIGAKKRIEEAYNMGKASRPKHQI